MSAERPTTTANDYELLRGFYTIWGERVGDTWLVSADSEAQQNYMWVRGDFLLRNFYADQFIELDERVRADLAAEAIWAEQLESLSPQDFQDQPPQA